MKEIKGNYLGKGKKIGIVISRFNEFIGNELLNGCRDALDKQGVNDGDITVVWTPGSFEIPQVVLNLAEKKKYDALIALGVIIRGDTPHFEYIASEVTKGIAAITMTKKIPVAYGVVVADSIEQAIERSGTKEGNKGRDAAMTAIEMANIYQQI